MKHPCKHCPYRRDVKPFLTLGRAEELAYLPSNPFNSFSCHKTTEYNEETEDMEVIESSKECAGFLTLRAQEGESVPEGFEPAWDIVYTDAFEMIQTYEDAQT